MPDAFQVKIGQTGFSVLHDHYVEYWESVANGSWEPDTVGTILSLVDGRWRFFDVGTWIGPTALLAASLGADVVSFEPDPVAYLRFISNVALNPQFRARIKCINAAAGNKKGRMEFFSDALGNSETSVFQARDRKQGRVLPSGSFEAEVVNFAEILEDMHERSRPSFFKVDIEGGEFELIPHIMPVIRKMPNVVIHLSTHSFNLTSEDPVRQLCDRLQAKISILQQLNLLFWWSWDGTKLIPVDKEHAIITATGNPHDSDTLVCSTWDLSFRH